MVDANVYTLHLGGLHINATLKSFIAAQAMWTVERRGRSPGEGDAVHRSGET